MQSQPDLLQLIGARILPEEGLSALVLGSGKLLVNLKGGSGFLVDHPSAISWLSNGEGPSLRCAHAEPNGRQSFLKDSVQRMWKWLNLSRKRELRENGALLRKTRHGQASLMAPVIIHTQEGPQVGCTHTLSQKLDHHSQQEFGKSDRNDICSSLLQIPPKPVYS